MQEKDLSIPYWSTLQFAGSCADVTADDIVCCLTLNYSPKSFFLPPFFHLTYMLFIIILQVGNLPLSFLDLTAPLIQQEDCRLQFPVCLSLIDDERRRVQALIMNYGRWGRKSEEMWETVGENHEYFSTSINGREDNRETMEWEFPKLATRSVTEILWNETTAEIFQLISEILSSGWVSIILC